MSVNWDASQNVCSSQSATVKYLLSDAITGSGLSGWDSGLLPADVQHCAWLIQRPICLQRQHDRRHHPAPHHWPKRCWSSKCIMYVNCSFLQACMHWTLPIPRLSDDGCTLLLFFFLFCSKSRNLFWEVTVHRRKKSDSVVATSCGW